MIRRLLLILVLAGMTLVANPMKVAAFDPFGGVGCNSSNSQSAVCTDKGNGSSDPVAGPNGLISKVVNIVAWVAGIAAIIVIIVGGINYIIANGDSNKISSAKNTIIYAAVGLVVIVIVRSLVVYVINHLT